MEENYKLTSWRKLLRSHFLWPRADGYYSSTGGTDVINGLLDYCIQKDIVDEIFGRGTSKFVSDYFKKQKINLSNRIIRDGCEQYYDTLKGTVYVESRKKDETDKHRVGVSNAVVKTSNDEKKNASFRNLIDSCDCAKTHFLTNLVAPIEVRKIFNDRRFADDIPAPNISMVIDNHAAAAYDWLVEERNAEDFGIFGLNDHTIGIASCTIKDVLNRSYKPEYELNCFLRDRTDLFNPLRERLGIKPLVLA